ncbi:hypothetical protein [Marinicrinis lubricantis]|uniref:Lipoprotein n=1 Tax=Marinicrinis lubricantis TaxID=2086470 RepID=A0ABW1IMX0_9BACL
MFRMRITKYVASVAMLLLIVSGCTMVQEEEVNPDDLLSLAAEKGRELKASYKGESSVYVNGKEIYRGQTYYRGNTTAEVMENNDSKNMMSGLTPLLTMDQLAEMKKEASMDPRASNDQYTVLKLEIDPEEMEISLRRSMQLQFDQIKKKYGMETLDHQTGNATKLSQEQEQFKKTLDSLKVKGAQYTLWIERDTYVPEKVIVDTTVNYTWNGAQQSEQLKGTYALQKSKKQ